MPRIASPSQTSRYGPSTYVVVGEAPQLKARLHNQDYSLLWQVSLPPSHWCFRVPQQGFALEILGVFALIGVITLSCHMRFQLSCSSLCAKASLVIGSLSRLSPRLCQVCRADVARLSLVKDSVYTVSVLDYG